MAQKTDFLESNDTSSNNNSQFEITLILTTASETQDFVTNKNKEIVDEATTEEQNETDSETESEQNETDTEMESEELNETDIEMETETKNQQVDSLCFTNFFNQLRVEEQFVASLLLKQQQKKKPNSTAIPQVWNSILGDDEDIERRVIYSEPEPIVKDCQHDVTMGYGFEKSHFSVDSFSSDEENNDDNYFNDSNMNTRKEKDYVIDTIYYVDTLLTDYYDSDEESETSTLFNEEPMVSRQTSLSAVVMTLVDKI